MAITDFLKGFDPEEEKPVAETQAPSPPEPPKEFKLEDVPGALTVDDDFKGELPQQVQDIKQVKYKNSLEKEFLKLTTILEDQNVPLPEYLTYPEEIEPEGIKQEREKRKYFTAGSAREFLDNFLRPGRVVGATIKNRISDIKALKALGEADNIQQAAEIARTQLASSWENIKKGAALEDEVGTFRDILIDTIGKERVEAGEAKFAETSKMLSTSADVFDMLAGRKPYSIRQDEKQKIDSKIDDVLSKSNFIHPRSAALLRGQLETQLDKETPLKDLPSEIAHLPYVVAAESTRALAKFVQWTPQITNLVAESTYDPLSWIPFGKVPEFTGMAFEGIAKGGLAAAAKVSPKAAEAIDKGIQFSKSKIVDVASAIDRKYGATNVAVKELGEEQGKSLIESIREVAASPKNQAEELVKGIKEEGAVPPRLGVVRRKLSKIAEEKGTSFDNYAMKWLFGQTPEANQIKSVSKALQRAEAETISILPKQFEGFTKETFSALVKDQVTPEEGERLLTAMRNSVPTKPRGGEFFLKEGQSLDEANLQFTTDLKGIFSDIKSGFTKEGIQIAKDRKVQAMAVIDANHSLMKNAVKVAEREAAVLEKEKLKAINKISKESVDLYRRTLGDFVKQGMESKVASGDVLGKAKLALSEDMDLFLKSKISRIEDGFLQKTADLKFGMPSLKELDGLYDEAVKGIETAFVKDKKFFSQASIKTKFLDTYNKTLAKHADVYSDIFERSIKDLPEPMQKFSRTFNETMDVLAGEEIDRGRLGARLPNYFPRLSRLPDGGPLLFDPAEFMIGKFRESGGSGISKHSQKRVMADFDSFKSYLDKVGGTAKEDPIELLYERFLKSKKDQSRFTITHMIPDELKVGKNGQRMKAYLDYLFDGGNSTDNWISKLGAKISSGYQYYTKALLTVFSPSFYVRNAMGFPFISAQGGGLRAFNPEHMIDAVALKTGSKYEMVNKLGEKITSDEFMKGMQTFGLINSSYTRGNIPQTVNDILGRYSKADPRYWITQALHYSQHVEDTGRLMAGVNFWKEGMPLYEAARRAKSTMYDFTDFNYIDRAFNGLFAFYGFSRKNVPAVLRTMYKDPKQYAILDRLVTTLSTGKQPSEADIQTLNDYDKDVLMVVRDLSLGKQVSYRLGFTPYEAMYQDFGKFLQGKPYEWLGKEINKFSPQLKLLYRELARNSESPTYHVQTKYAFLPREYSAMSDGQVKVLNGLSQWMGFGPVEKKPRTVTEYGEKFEEDGIFVNPRMYDLITMSPGSRIGKEWAGLIKQFSDDTKTPEYEATVGRLVKDGYISDSEKLIRYVTGIRSDVIDWNKLRENKLKTDVRKLREIGQSRGIVNVIPYLPKDIRNKYESMWKDKELELNLKKAQEINEVTQ